MDSMSYLGTFIVSNAESVKALPVFNESGLWHVWRTGDGSVIVQALDTARIPQGPGYSLTPDNFTRLLRPGPNNADPAPERPQTITETRKNAEDLLAQWYEKALATEPAAASEKSPCPDAPPICMEQDHVAPVAAHPLSGERLPLPPANAPLPGSGSEEPEGTDMAPEDQARHWEQRMRTAFSRLMEQYDAGPNPALDREISALLAKGEGFTWRQKFMFTEFGLQLRRRRKPGLALECHLRALFFSPNDEHILFNVARAEFELGNVEKAREHLRKALNAAPDFALARNFLHFLN